MDLSGVPPMAFVVTGIIAITGINIVNRLAVNSIKTRWGVIAANYVIALTLSLLIFAANGYHAASAFTIGLAVVSGMLYIGGMYLGMTTIGRRGASIAVSASQLSVLIPVSLSVLIYGDSLSTTQLIGVGVALVSLPLLAAKSTGLNGALDRGTFALIVIQLVVQGFAQFTSKVLVATGLGGERDAFFVVVFAAATLMTIPVASGTGER
ncbi:TPA: hypothetical protein HA344_06475 [Candidatus Bathyarchaeota archaeon]|nr:hypothetical protein [Candidatus Bathyarchaeota archaeon]